MSALAKLYASRSPSTSGASPADRSDRAPSVVLDSSSLSYLRQNREGVANRAVSKQSDSRDSAERKIDRNEGYSSALDVLENVNSGFLDIFDRLQSVEEEREKLVQECNVQENRIRELEAALGEANARLENLELQRSNIADDLLAETARSAELETRFEEASQTIAQAQAQISGLENVCKTLHDGIYAVFGTGSPAQKALNTLSRA